MDHAASIRRVARQLAAIEDLQQRVDSSHEARILQAIRKPGSRGKPEREPLVWPRALRECVTEDDHFRNTPQHPVDDGGLDDPDWHRQQQEADIVHRLLGLVG
ncbi:hypothetical protein ACWIID_44500 [Streptomyces phaeochromogenes]